MNYHDKIAAHTQHLKKIYNFDPERVEKEMLSKLPFSTLTEIPRPGSRIARERAARLQELIHFCATGGMSQSGNRKLFINAALIFLFCILNIYMYHYGILKYKKTNIHVLDILMNKQFNLFIQKLTELLNNLCLKVWTSLQQIPMASL